MSYVDAGYVVALVVLVAYALSLVGRERTARRRLGEPAGSARMVGVVETDAGVPRGARERR